MIKSTAYVTMAYDENDFGVAVHCMSTDEFGRTANLRYSVYLTNIQYNQVVLQAIRLVLNSVMPGNRQGGLRIYTDIPEFRQFMNDCKFKLEESLPLEIYSLMALYGDIYVDTLDRNSSNTLKHLKQVAVKTTEGKVNQVSEEWFNDAA